MKKNKCSLSFPGRFIIVAVLMISIFYADAKAFQLQKKIEGDNWNLDLPPNPVSRRISRHFKFKGPKPVELANISGPGCIKRFWITGNNIGRDVVLRIYFDNEKVPYVEAPLTDFFGAMHNMMKNRYPHDHTRTALPTDSVYTINTPLLTINPKNSMTAYFEMPFANNARFEVIGSNKNTDLYYSVDWHEYPGQTMKETRRFASSWRRESPVRDYSDEFILLDADGPGQLIGFVYSVDMLQSREIMRWSHAGGDNIYIDGDGEHPTYLRGIGGEDVFGTSFGGSDYLGQSSLYNDMPFYMQKDTAGDKQKMVGYRFFMKDAIQFKKSLHMRFAARAHDIASIAYWYTAKPVRPFYTMPPLEKRLPGSTLLRGEFDLPLPATGSWLISGPFSKNSIKDVVKSGSKIDVSQPLNGKDWQKYTALRGFVDFNHVYRPEASNRNSPVLDEAMAVAHSIIDAPMATTAKITLGWDDQVVISINNGKPIELGKQPYFRDKSIEVQLQKGKNTIDIWYSNTNGYNNGGWAFSLNVVTKNGLALVPHGN
jgi:hypothetical protein